MNRHHKKMGQYVAVEMIPVSNHMKNYFFSVDIGIEHTNSGYEYHLFKNNQDGKLYAYNYDLNRMYKIELDLTTTN